MKLKEQLIAMGIAENVAQKVIDEIIDGNYVPKSRFNEINEKAKNLETQVADRDKQLEDLKKSSGDNEALKKQIETLQQTNAAQKKDYEGQIAKIRLDNAIDSALGGSGAKNVNVVRGVLDLTKIKLGSDGKLSGLDEQITALQKSDAYLFESKTPKLKGATPGESSDKKPGGEIDLSKMTYTELAAYMAEHPETKLDD